MPPVKGQMHSYSEEQMLKAIADVKSGRSVASAAKANSVPRTTLLSKINGKTPYHRRMGPEAILSKTEENLLVQWLFEMAKCGFPVGQNQFLDTVQCLIKHLKKETPFTDGRPGRSWFAGFCKRNPQVSARIAQNLTASRAAVSKNSLDNWFIEVYNHLKEEGNDNILEDPSRIFNADEAAFFLNPKSNKVLVPRGSKNVYQVVNTDEKECLTVLINCNASGAIAPPMIVFNYERIPTDIAESVPSDWAVGKSDSGWMTGELFYEYITNIFYPWLLKENVARPVILFIDGHVSHLTLPTSTFCSKNGIILVALLPNSTHLTQPMDVAVFRTLKDGWKEAVKKWRNDHFENPVFKKKYFAPVLKETIKERVTAPVLKNGFRKCGLYPWNSQALDFSKITNHTADEEPQVPHVKPAVQHQLFPPKETITTVGLNILEERIGDIKLQQFKATQGQWEGDVRDYSLFYIWKELSTEVEKKGENVNIAHTLTIEDVEHSDNIEAIGITGNIPLENLDVNLSGDLEFEEHLDLVEDTSLANVFILDEGSDIQPVEELLENGEKNVDIVQKENNNDRNGEENIMVIEDEDLIMQIIGKDMINSNEEDKTSEQNECDGEPKSEGHPTTSKSGNENCTKGQFIPSPFKKALFWPEPKKLIKKERKEKIPSVASGEQWRKYHQQKQLVKKEKEEAKAKRAAKRKKQLEEKVQKNKCKSKNTKTRDYLCMSCNASWNEENLLGIKSVWIDCDKCHGSIHVKCVTKEHGSKFGLDDPSFGDSDCDFCCENCENFDDLNLFLN